MVLKYTYYWQRSDFDALEKVRGKPAGWGAFEFAQRSLNNYKIMVPEGWEAPSVAEQDKDIWEKSNKGLQNVAIIVGIFFVIPWIIKKARQNGIRF